MLTPQNNIQTKTGKAFGKALTTPGSSISEFLFYFIYLRQPQTTVEDELSQCAKSGEQRECVNGGMTVS